MDTYHKILVRIYQETGGRDTVDVDLTDLLKQEGYLPSMDDICSRMKGESWVTESRPNVVRITHWGVAEAKKAGIARPDAARALERETRRLIGEAREFAVVLEEFLHDPSAEKRKAVDKKFELLQEIHTNVKGL